MQRNRTPYTATNLHRLNLQKLIARDVQGARRINPRGRSHANVHYVPVQTESITDRGRTYDAVDRNASVLARVAEMPGSIRVRFIYGIKDAKGNILDSYSTGAVDIKEYSWEEMRQFFEDDSAVQKQQKQSPLKARKQQEEKEPEDEELDVGKEEPEDYPMLYIVWEKVR